MQNLLRRRSLRMIGIVVVGLLAACQREAAAPALPAAAPATPYKLSASIGEIMQSIVDPAADQVWESVGTTITQKAVDNRRPSTDAEWLAVRHGVITLLEATNLLMMPGRKMVPPNGKMVDEGSEGVLTAAEGQQRLEAQSAVFAGFASSLHDVAEKLLKATDEKNPEALFELGGDMDAVCEACHMTFWYPNQPVYKASKGK